MEKTGDTVENKYYLSNYFLRNYNKKIIFLRHVKILINDFRDTFRRSALG